MKRLIRWPVVALLATLLVAPIAPGPARAAPDSTAPAASVPAPSAPQIDTSAGVGHAITCGLSVGVFVLTGAPLMFVLAAASCTMMIVDALNTPDP